MPIYTAEQQALSSKILEIAHLHGVERIEEHADPKTITLYYTRWQQGFLVLNKLSELVDRTDIEWNKQGMFIKVSLGD